MLILIRMLQGKIPPHSDLALRWCVFSTPLGIIAPTLSEATLFGFQSWNGYEPEGEGKIAYEVYVIASNPKLESLRLKLARYAGIVTGAKVSNPKLESLRLKHQTACAPALPCCSFKSKTEGWAKHKIDIFDAVPTSFG
jgi:hypothetical protein